MLRHSLPPFVLRLSPTLAMQSSGVHRKAAGGPVGGAGGSSIPMAAPQAPNATRSDLPYSMLPHPPSPGLALVAYGAEVLYADPLNNGRAWDAKQVGSSQFVCRSLDKSV